MSFNGDESVTELDVVEYLQYLLIAIKEGTLELKTFDIELVDQTTQKFAFTIGPRKIEHGLVP